MTGSFPKSAATGARATSGNDYLNGPWMHWRLWEMTPSSWTISIRPVMPLHSTRGCPDAPSTAISSSRKRRRGQRHRSPLGQRLHLWPTTSRTGPSNTLAGIQSSPWKFRQQTTCIGNGARGYAVRRRRQSIASTATRLSPMCSRAARALTGSPAGKPARMLRVKGRADALWRRAHRLQWGGCLRG